MGAHIGHACRPSVVVPQREQNITVVAIERVREVLSTRPNIVRLQIDGIHMMIYADA